VGDFPLPASGAIGVPAPGEDDSFPVRGDAAGDAPASLGSFFAGERSEKDVQITITKLFRR
jgi:hypothetical protein